MKPLQRSTLPIVLSLLYLVAVFGQAPPQVFQGNELEGFLNNARITDMNTLGTGITVPSKATLELAGRTEAGVWKTIDVARPGTTRMANGDFEVDFQDSWRTEIAAYELDKLIGLGMVPATVGRTVRGERGSLQFWVQSKMSEGDRVKNKVNPPNAVGWMREMSKVWLFDNLISNADRHAGNLLITEDFQIRLIDHSRAFRPSPELRDPKQLSRFSRSLMDRLEQLTEPEVREKLRDYLTSAQIDGLLKRRDRILELVQRLIKEKGEALVFYP